MSSLVILRALKRIRITQVPRTFVKSQPDGLMYVRRLSSKYFLSLCHGRTTFRTYASTNENKEGTNESALDSIKYERVCSETLDALCDYLEELIENAKTLSSSDVAYGDGVLTVKLGPEYGTYVINRQTPNKQIWLSSPTSGPKRYDFVATSSQSGRWIYKHNGESMHELLQRELQEILREQHIDFSKLPYGR
ncbi:PREDICTED: frataxin homolog, mitochondrial isoform X1 [Rhagoletis zephyria]|uniref:frataxin homolog, mitochondrial isoform X1 n=1 Tax=Rhagoletis zephyria TaxID=28612 RepID=UPI0008115E83|nr:PREDICTED: frataxin homolog, mitochondrial isoform X1 [Rhagoletis zephyria]